jgi:hypothetical protein
VTTEGGGGGGVNKGTPSMPKKPNKDMDKKCRLGEGHPG